LSLQAHAGEHGGGAYETKRCMAKRASVQLNGWTA